MKVPGEFKIEEACSKDETRYVLNSPYFTTDPRKGETNGRPVLVATDGYIIAVVPVWVPEEGGDLGGQIPIEAFAKRKNRRHKEDGEWVVEPQAVNIDATKIGSVSVNGAQIERQTVGFPNWPVVEASMDDSEIVVPLDAELLYRLARALGSKRVVLGIKKGRNAIAVEPTMNADRAVRGTIMGIRIDGELAKKTPFTKI